MGNFIDLTGARFGRWLVVGRAPNRKERTCWLCQCDCGNRRVVSGTSLREGASKSCGCLHRDVVSLPPGEAAFNVLFSSYRRNAKTRGLVWSLSKEQFRGLAQGDCFYCGAPPAQAVCKCGNNGEFVYNGVDRLDNDQGYTPENVATCCWQCNKAKKAMGLPEFKQWAEALAATLAKTGWELGNA